MKRILTLLVIAIVAITGNTYAQYAGDALKFSQSTYGSSARFKAMGGAQIGVGGDLSSLGGNPAGLGLFTKSEFNITPLYSSMSSDVNYLSFGTNTTKGSPNLGQAGVALYLPAFKQKGRDATKGFVSLVLGLGYNRVEDFDNEYNYSGTNLKNSAADYYAELAGSTLPANLPQNSLQNWAYQNYLISYDPSGYYFPETFVNNTQSSNDVRKGGTSELNFNAAVNISNNLYIGVNVNYISLRYVRDANFLESGIARGYSSTGVLIGSTVPYKLNFIQSQTTEGEGVNGRVGVIFRPVPEFRIGMSVQTPTYMEIRDTYFERLDNRGSTNGNDNSNTYNFTYELRTPLKASVGASYVIGGTALLSADVDYVDYSTIKLSQHNIVNSAVLAQDNADVRTNNTQAINFRVGGEYKIDNLSLRGGFGYNGSPYKNSSNFDSKSYSGGIGYRMNNYYLDLAYQRLQFNNTYRPYVLSDASEPVADINTAKNNVFLTVGLRF